MVEFYLGTAVGAAIALIGVILGWLVAGKSQ